MPIAHQVATSHTCTMSYLVIPMGPSQEEAEQQLKSTLALQETELRVHRPALKQRLGGESRAIQTDTDSPCVTMSA